MSPVVVQPPNPQPNRQYEERERKSLVWTTSTSSVLLSPWASMQAASFQASVTRVPLHHRVLAALLRRDLGGGAKSSSRKKVAIIVPGWTLITSVVRGSH